MTNDTRQRQWLTQTYAALEKALVAKTKAEKMLAKYYTNAFWTIIRPGGLQTAPATGKAILTDDKTVAGVISRADVSAALDSQVNKHALFVCHIATPSGGSIVAGANPRHVVD